MKDTSSIMHCLFCPNLLSTSTKFEHIIQKSIGGSLKSRSLICDQCNEEFSRDIDLTLAQKYARVMNALGPALSGDAPNLELVDKTSKRRMRLESGVVPQITRAEIVELPNGRKVIKGANEDHVNKIAKQLWNKKAEKLIYDSIEESGDFEGDAPVIHEGEFRAVTKICLEYLRFMEHAVSEQIDIAVIRDYVRHDVMPPKRICYIQEDISRYQAIFDSRISSHPFCHRLGISLGPHGSQAIVLLFNSIPFRIMLSSTVIPKTKSYLYQRNILKGVTPSTSQALEQELDFGDFDSTRINRQGMMNRENNRIIQLCVDADWHVNLNCKDHIVESYLCGFRRGHKPGESITIAFVDMLDLIFDRTEKVFLKKASAEVRAESQNIRKSLEKKPQDASQERVDQFSVGLKKKLWELHLEAFQLHKKYVSAPKSRYNSLRLYVK